MNEEKIDLKILLIEDDKAMQRVFADKLSKQNIQILIAGNQEKALKIINEEKPDAVLLDVDLSGKDGFEILEKIRSDSELKDILVLILTNSDSNEDIIKAKDLGADDFLLKVNFSIDEVVKRINDHLKK